MNQLGPRIKKLRISKSLSQEEVASKLFLSVKAYQNIEHGITKLDLERLNQIADIFEISLADLINSSELKIKFDEQSENNYQTVKNKSTYSSDSEINFLLLQEKDNEIAYLKDLVKKIDTIFLRSARQPEFLQLKSREKISSQEPAILSAIHNRFKEWFTPQEVCNVMENMTKDEVEEVCLKFTPWFFKAKSEKNGWSFIKRFTIS